MTIPLRRSKDIPAEPVSSGVATTRQVLTAKGEGDGFHMRRFSIGPGGSMPRHRNVVEHQQVVLSGQATIGIGDATYRVSAGDVVHIPGGTPHWYRTEGDRPFEFLCVIPDAPDRIELLPDESAPA